MNSFNDDKHDIVKDILQQKDKKYFCLNNQRQWTTMQRPFTTITWLHAEIYYGSKMLRKNSSVLLHMHAGPKSAVNSIKTINFRICHNIETET